MTLMRVAASQRPAHGQSQIVCLLPAADLALLTDDPDAACIHIGSWGGAPDMLAERVDGERIKQAKMAYM